MGHETNCKTWMVRYRYAMEHIMEVKAESREEAERIAQTEFDCQDLSNDSFVELEDIDVGRYEREEDE